MVGIPDGSTADSSGAWASGPPWASGRPTTRWRSRRRHAYTDSFFDLPLLMAVGHPHPLNADPRLLAVALARRWPLEHWDRPAGIPSLVASSRITWSARSSGPRPSPTPGSTIHGLEHIPDRGPVLLASNHRSYFDVAAIGIVAARLGRPVRFLAKQEVFDAPIVGRLARAVGGIAVERGAGSSEPMRRAAAALRAGEVVIVLPQGTIPRGRSFFDPVLQGHTGTARLAAETGAPVVPIGLWGTERVWPRSSRVPNMTALPQPPRVTITVGQPLALGLERRGGGHRRADGGHRRPAARGVPGPAHPDRRGAGPDPPLGVTVPSPTPPRRLVPPRRRGRASRPGGQLALARLWDAAAAPWPAGRVGLALDPSLLATLATGCQVALVTGTNGKTTTTRHAGGGAARARRVPDVVSNVTGANMPAGHVAALAGARRVRPPCSRSTKATWAG